MIIYDSTGNVVLDIEVDDTSVRYKAIKGENSLTLKFSLAEHIEIPLGAYAVFKNEKYSLMQPEDFVMHHRRNFEYSVVMYSEDAKSKRYKFVNPVDGRLKFSLTAKPQEHLQMFVDNMNMRDSGWSVGECPDHVEIVLSYNHTYCYDALVQLADALELDFWFEGKRVNIGKLELNKNNPLSLSYGGDGEGLNPDIKRNNYSEALPIEVLYVQGTEVNINPDKYRVDDKPANELHLPLSYTIGYDGTHFDDEDGFDSSKARYYMTDSLGRAIRRAGKDAFYYSEDSLDCTEIEPTKEETVASVVEVDVEDHFYDILFDSAVDYSKYVIEGEKATIVFQSGMLAGKEFDLATDTNGNLICKKEEDGKWRVEIVPQQLDGITMPDKEKGFIPLGGENGDKFKVFGVQLPDEYVAEAEMNMLKYAVKHFYTNEDVQYTIAGELDEIYAKKNWVNIEGRLNLGNYVSFTDKSFQEEPLLIRIIGIKEFVNKPHSPILELSNAAVAGSLIDSINRMENQEAYTEKIVKDSRQFTKRTFADIRRAMKMLEDAFGEGFDPSLKPVTIQTMMMLVGDETLQFAFVEAIGSDKVVPHKEYFDTETKTFKCDAGFIKHYTLDVKEIRSKFDQTYRYWTMPQYESAVLDDASKEYYVYAIVSKVGDDLEINRFSLEPSAIGMRDKESEGEYYLLLGLLLAEYEGSRDFMPLYGFTQILPGQITTDVIRSADGSCYFDLANNTIAGRLSFINNNDEVTEIADWSSSINTRINKKADQAALDELESSVDAQIAGFQKQIDGVIETWFYDDEPTLDNAPANEWTEDADKEKHIGDLYYSKAGKAYRFQKDADGVYYWNPIADEDIAKALEAAQEAQDTADNKRRVFTSTPKPPYDKGDLWTNGTDLYVCNTSRSAGSYVSTDWKLATNYTDDTVANNALEKAAEAISDAGSALSAAGQAQSDAAAAKKAAEEAEKSAQEAASDAQTAASDAEKAKQEAEAASGRVQEWAEDGVISPLEVQALKNELAQIEADYNEISANLTKYGLTNTTYESAYNSYKSDLESKIDTVSSGSSVEIGNLATLQSDYYTKRTAVLGQIADAAKKVADDAQKKADDAQKAADNAQEAADNASDLASKAQAAADAAKAVADEATSKIDGDGYFTEIEKKAIRSLIAEISECTGTLYTENAIVSRRTISGNEWKIVKKGDVATVYDSFGKSYKVPQDEFIGYYGSNLHAAGDTITQMNIDVKRPFTLRLRFLADSKSQTLAYAAAGPLGKDVTPTYSYSGHGEAQDKNTYTYRYGLKEEVFKSYSIESDSYIQLSYKKTQDDGMYSTTPRTDSAYYKLANDIFVAQDGDHIVDMAGSFHRYYLLLQQLGYDQIAQSLYNALDKVFVLLKTNKLWEKGTTESTTDFRTTLNTYLTDYYGVLALCGFNIMDSKVSDLDYLANAMRDGSTVIEGGLVMTSLVAVGDTETTDADVEAFMNGSDFASDEEHGKLLHALGIPEETEAGSADLEARAKEAKTRMYEDGTIYSSSLKLKEGCEIGSLRVYADGHIGVGEGCPPTGTAVNSGLSEYGLSAGLYRNIDSTCQVPSRTEVTAEQVAVIHTEAYYEELDKEEAPFYAQCPSGKVAFACGGGLFSGLRPHISKPSSPATLTEDAHTVIIASGYLYLPSIPQDGQEYKIIHTTATALYIRNLSTTNGNIWDFKNATGKSYTITSSAKETIELIYSAADATWYANKY